MSEINKNPQMKIEGCKVISVIQTISLEGAGIEDSPFRAITRYWDFDGRLLAISDPKTNTISNPYADVMLLSEKVNK